ncbi:hypothetical protein HJC23_011732 [Cyclotella cryptica]|uniref:Corrinoid adenosyltransferase MMAB n=1 Tax=Cyclotella cryptica TaxID=29204 RepID=A0ABD3NR87_9STRA|eukprot:CCRYP_020719-RA/>CCRYP_020719-RA protein AED:0.11 eAED:0.11 QI:0/-1/0/1/-1/1/1/0/461
MFLPAQYQRSLHIVRTLLQRQTKASSPLLCNETTSLSQFHGTIRLSSCSAQKSVAFLRDNSDIDFSRVPFYYAPMKPKETAQNNPKFNDTDIEDLHRQAILAKESTYIDPSTGFTVFTELAHLKRGKCCGNMCRHCPYGYSNVKGLDFPEEGKVRSGDRDATGRLVKKILDGTYYETDGGACSNGCSANGQPQSYSVDKVGAEEKSTENSVPVASSARGKGGYAGGTLTSKNVPYTRKGDAGTSQLFTGERRSKDDMVFEAMGTVDELCSVVGTVYAQLMASNMASSNDSANSTHSTTHSVYGDLPEQLLDVMSRLFDVGSHIARPIPKQAQDEKSTTGKATYSPHHADLLEEWIDTMTEQLPELTSFILPTGSPASAQLHVARTVCRRAERRTVPLVRDHESCEPAALAYLNRLSDYLFTAARYVNYCEGKDEVQYRRERGVSDDTASTGRERVVVRLKD